MYLIQRCDTGFMVREFLGHSSYYRGEYMNPHYSTWEVRRALFDKNGKSVSAYNWGVYKQQHARWIKNNVCYPRSIKYYWEMGKIYGKSLPALFKDELKVTGLQEYLQKNPVTDPEMYLAFYKAVPLLEKLVKADMSDMVTEYFNNPSDYINFFQNNEEPSLIKALGIDSPRKAVEIEEDADAEKLFKKIAPDLASKAAKNKKGKKSRNAADDED